MGLPVMMSQVWHANGDALTTTYWPAAMDANEGSLCATDVRAKPLQLPT